AAVTAADAKLSADQAKLDGDQAKLAGNTPKTPAESTSETALITAERSAITADQDAHTAAVQQLTTAQANLAATTLRAPAAATVAQANIAAGQNIGNGGGGGVGSAGSGGSNQASSAGSAGDTTSVGSSAAITLANSALQALGQVSDSQIAQVRVGQQALVTPAGQTTAIDGRVEAITPTATTSGGVTTYPIKIGWSGHETGVLDGMSAQISIVVTKTSGLTVPSSAVHTSGTHSWVMVLQGARVRNGRGRGGQETRHPIDVGPSGGGLTIVRSGLQAGAQVVLADNGTPLPSSPGNVKGSGKASQLHKLLG
ncbi:MAG TPA: HlyD family efflux transporter periplasmic adaptor subunit, partial [Solirubrobacteraceae bacterium]|nr:HlyD family efflux transporter periplasmic adaptor subunit [Solirubrobacteraceae bacterium]